MIGWISKEVIGMNSLQVAFDIDLSFSDILFSFLKHCSDAVLKAVPLFLQGEVFVVLIKAILVEVDGLINGHFCNGHG